MFTPDQYQLIDFGAGRRLECFGGLTIDRPCPAVEDFECNDPAAWRNADARFERGDGEEGKWTCNCELPETWTITHGPATFELKPTPVGQIGVFPEQAANWDWIAERLRSISQPIKILNLFAYTGGSTLSAAAAGAEVTHVDAARNAVARARRNAELSGLSDAPIRWIAEDAVKFVQRELRRGNRYDAVVLDPPSYGHGPNGEVWRLAKHLPRLLGMCAELTAGRRLFMLLTCHTPGYDPARLKQMVGADIDGGAISANQLTIRSTTGREMPGGVVVRLEPRAA